VLLSLEYIRLRIFILLVLIFEGRDLFYGIIYITFTACEGALGLSVLVMMRRTHGGDFFRTFNLV
jgi:NADH-ubiquinone oxidoreductase chain 4L